MDTNSVPIDPGAALFGFFILGILPLILCLLLLKIGIKWFKEYLSKTKGLKWYQFYYWSDGYQSIFLPRSPILIFIGLGGTIIFGYITLTVFIKGIWPSVIAPLFTK